MKVDVLMLLLIALVLFYLTFLTGRAYQAIKTLDYIQEQTIIKYEEEGK